MTTILFFVILCLSLALKILISRVEKDKKSSPDKDKEDSPKGFDL